MFHLTRATRTKPARVVDPVCAMTVDPEKANASADYQGVTYYFCAQHCARTFEADPATYAGAARQP